MAEFAINEAHVVRLIADYLAGRGSYETLCALLLESNTSEYTLTNCVCEKEFLYLQRLILQGRFDDAQSYLQPILDECPEIAKDVTRALLRQKFLETMSWQGGGGEKLAFPPFKPTPVGDPDRDRGYGVELENLLTQLKYLKPVCAPEEFNMLCVCLTIERLDAHPMFLHWTVSQGRVECVRELFPVLNTVMCLGEEERATPTASDSSRGLFRTIALGLGFTAQSSSGGDEEKVATEWDPATRCIASIGASSPTNESSPVEPAVTVTQEVGFIRRFDGVAPPFARTMVRTTRQEARAYEVEDFPPMSSFSVDEDKKASSSSETKVSSQVPTPIALPVAQGDFDRNADEVVSVGSAKSTAWVVSMNDDGSEDDKAKMMMPIGLRKKMGGGAVEADVKSVPSPINPPTNRSPSPSGDSLGALQPPLPPCVAPGARAAEAPSWPRPSNGGGIGDGFGAGIGDVAGLGGAVRTSAMPPSNAKFPSNMPLPPGLPSQGSITKSPVSSSKSPLSSVFEPKKICIYSTECPLRCAVQMQQIDNSYDDTFNIAIGSNAKCIYTKQYSTSIQSSSDVSAGHDFQNLHKGSVYTIDWHVSQRLLVSGSNDKTIRISSPSTGVTSAPLKGHNGTIRVVRFNPASSIYTTAVASVGAGDCAPRIWDVSTGQCIMKLTAHSDTAHALQWLDSNLIVTGCESGQIIGHDIRTSHIAAWSYSLGAQQFSDASVASGGGSTVSGTVASSAASDNCISTMSIFGTPDSLPLDAKNTPIIVGGANGFVTVLNSYDGRIIARQKLHSDDVKGVSLFSVPSLQRRLGKEHGPAGGLQGKALLTCSHDGIASLWDIEGGGGGQTSFRPICNLVGHQGKILSAIPLLSNNEEKCRVLTTGADGIVNHWDI